MALYLVLAILCLIGVSSVSIQIAYEQRFEVVLKSIGIVMSYSVAFVLLVEGIIVTIKL